MSGLTLKELSVKILKENHKPMNAEEIWDYALEKNYNSLVSSSGKTPWNTISAAIYLDIRDNKDTKFVKVGKNPTRFFLKQMTGNEQRIAEEVAVEAVNLLQKLTERDLHKLLTYYSYNFMRLYTRTIYHEKSKKKDKGANEWLHPDIVGFYFPLKDWEQPVLEFSNGTGSTPIRLYSFEMKKELDFSNIRSAFFQTVSNSSWANESYLVAAKISDDGEFIDELRRLSTSFGIGVINLDIDDPNESKIVFPAKYRTELDWDTLNKLCEENPDFKEFLGDINACITSKKIYPQAYDRIYSLEELIRELNK